MAKEISRYTDKVFPPYRFIPGKNPHPTEDPKGHSYGKTEPVSEKIEPGNWRSCESYLYGVDLYNHRYWWEAHEAWEGLWRNTANEYCREFLQGLIKVSAALLKMELQQARGIETLFEGAIGHLQRVEKKYPSFMGIDLTEYLNHVKQYSADSAQEYPYLRLKKD